MRRVDVRTFGNANDLGRRLLELPPGLYRTRTVTCSRRTGRAVQPAHGSSHRYLATITWRRLSVNDKQVAEGRIDKTVPVVFSTDDTFDIGADWGTPVSPTYRPPFEFTGTLKQVTVEAK